MTHSVTRSGRPQYKVHDCNDCSHGGGHRKMRPSKQIIGTKPKNEDHNPGVEEDNCQSTTGNKDDGMPNA